MPKNEDKVTHRYIGNHVISVGPLMVGPGDMVTLTDEDKEDPYIAELIEAGTFLDLNAKNSGGE